MKVCNNHQIGVSIPGKLDDAFNVGMEGRWLRKEGLRTGDNGEFGRG
jgi:hypothetical protein